MWQNRSALGRTQAPAKANSGNNKQAEKAMIINVRTEEGVALGNQVSVAVGGQNWLPGSLTNCGVIN